MDGHQVLKRLGWRVKSKATYSERVVKTRLDQARWQARALFWLERLPGEGVEDPDAEAEDLGHPEATPAHRASMSLTPVGREADPRRGNGEPSASLPI